MVARSVLSTRAGVHHGGRDSTTTRGIPTEVALGKRDGLPKRCVANADSIATTWLESRILPPYREVRGS